MLITLARKPLNGATVVQNCLQHGCGALNIDASRIATIDSLGGGRLTGPTRMSDTCGGPEWDRPWMKDINKRQSYAQETASKVALAEALGRFPANVLHDGSEAVLEGFPLGGASGKASGKTLTGSSTAHSRGKFNGVEDTPFYADSGSAARFFKQIKS